MVGAAVWGRGRDSGSVWPAGLPTRGLCSSGGPPSLPRDCDSRQASLLSLAGSPPVRARPSFADGKPVEVDPHHILIEDPDGSCALILDNLTGMDSGQYMCFAASAAGNASTLGKILVQGEPTLEGRLE